MISLQPIIVDSNVLLEGFLKPASAGASLLRAANQGAVEFILIANVLAELYYKSFDISQDRNVAGGIVASAMRLKNATLVPIDDGQAIVAGGFYLDSNFYQDQNGRWVRKPMVDPNTKNNIKTLSLTDCLILAVGATMTRSTVCTWDGVMRGTAGVNVKTPKEVLGIT